LITIDFLDPPKIREEENAMSSHNIEKFFNPKAIAIIGASPKENSVGYKVMTNMRTSGYQGHILPFNPNYPEMMGLKCYASFKDTPVPVDLVVIATPIKTVPKMMKECVEAKVGAAVVLSGGGKETGEEGRKIEEEIKKEAERGDIRIIGPNTLGVICSKTGINATFAPKKVLPGKVAVIAQSGALLDTILGWSLVENVGFSHLVSLGSMLDVDFTDLVEYLGKDDHVSGILLYVEGMEDVGGFMRAAQAVSQFKPIFAIKVGRSEAGARAAVSHTGALTGEDAVWDEAFKRAGIVRINNLSELFDCAVMIGKQAPPSRSGLVIISDVGGAAVLATEELGVEGVEPVKLSAELVKRLDGILPPFWSRRNPIDMVSVATPEVYAQVIQCCMEAPEVESLLLIIGPQAGNDPPKMAEILGSKVGRGAFPTWAIWTGKGNGFDEGKRMMAEAGIPSYLSPEQAVRSFLYMSAYRLNLEMRQKMTAESPPKFEVDHHTAARFINEAIKQKRPFLTEPESKALLKAYGIPAIRTEAVSSVDEAVSLARHIGFPVVLKLLSENITHKSEAGGVKLNLTGEDQVRRVFAEIMDAARVYDPKAKVLGVTIQPMVARHEFELILGCKKDKYFGPVILFGLGGIMTEILRDRALGLPPLNRSFARQMMESTKAYQLLKGYRGLPGANLVLLEEILIRLSQLVTDFPEVVELDINPMVVVADQVWALDARVVAEPSPVPSPYHLVFDGNEEGSA
jgi:acetyltransferase